jgi:hypothetical protein
MLKLELIFKLLVFFVWLDQDLAPAQTFGTVTMGGGGYVDGIISCPTQTNLFYCKTDVGGAYRWDETNQAWIPLLDWCSESQTTFMGVESLAIDPSSPNKLYILAGTSYWNSGDTAILISTNYGSTFAISDVTSKFKASGNGANRQKGETLAVDPNNGAILFCGSRANGLFKSLDSGLTWNAVSSFNTNITIATDSISFVNFDPTTGTAGNPTPRIFVGVYRTGTNFFVSNDAGTNWTPFSTNPTNSYAERCALAGNHQLYISYGNETTHTNGGIMKFNTTNNAWLNCTPAIGEPYCGISVCATNPLKLVASTYSIYKHQPWGPYGDLIYVSANGGTNWVDIFTSNLATEDGNGFTWANGNQINWAGVTMDPFNPNRVFTGSGNGLYCTTNLNSGLTSSAWKFMVKGLEETVPINFISVLDGPFITSVGDYGGLVFTNITVPPLTGTISQSTSFAYAALQSNFIARVVANGELYYSKTTPVTWTKFPSTPGVMTNGAVAIAANGTSVLWKSTACFVTTNLGTNWLASNGLTFTCNPEADTVNPAKFYAYNPSDGFLYASTDGGFNFIKQGSAGTGGSATFCTAPGFEGHIWIALNNNGLKYSTNSGTNFVSDNVSVCKAVAFGKTAPGGNYPAIYIWGQPTSGSTSGMYRSTDRGATWTRVNDNLHQYGGLGNAGIIEADKNVFGRVYMSTVGRGVPYVDSSVNVSNITVAPLAFSTYVTGTRQLTATVLPANANYPSYTWASSNTAVASVNASGLVTANAAGSTTLTATTLDGGFVANSVITVTNLLSSPVVTLQTGSNSSMTLSWPADHRGWLLQVQTNSLNTGLGTNWSNIAGSGMTNQVIIVPAINNASVFYRLVSP